MPYAETFYCGGIAFSFTDYYDTVAMLPAVLPTSCVTQKDLVGFRREFACPIAIWLKFLVDAPLVFTPIGRYNHLLTRWLPGIPFHSHLSNQLMNTFCDVYIYNKNVYIYNNKFNKYLYFILSFADTSKNGTPHDSASAIPSSFETSLSSTKSIFIKIDYLNVNKS